LKPNVWLTFVVTAALEFGVIGAAGWVAWTSMTPADRNVVTTLWLHYAGTPLLAGLLLLILLGLGVNLIFRCYINPLRTIADEVRVIAMSNPGRRLQPNGIPELRDLIEGVNLLAESYQELQKDVSVKIRDANVVLEEEKNTLAVLMSKLTQGVLVCNREGKILLYNQSAQALLEGSATQNGVDWLGLGRSVSSLLDGNLIVHALSHIEYRLGKGESGVMAPFVATRRGGQVLNVHLVPVLDKENVLTGYILTLEDITRLTATENHQRALVQSLTEGQRSAIAGIRAAIETMLSYPDMGEAQSLQFKTIIRDEVLKLSQHLDQMLAEYSQDLSVQLTLKEMLGSDLLATMQRQLRDSLGIDMEMSAPLEPLWLRVDSYAFVQGITFVTGKLLNECGAERIQLKLASQPPFASLEITWQGRFLDMETLSGWGKETLTENQQGSALTLHDTIDRHGCAVWTHADSTPGRCSVHLLLPLASGEEQPAAGGAGVSAGHSYDFSLFHQPSHAREWDTLPLSELSYTVIDTETTGLNPTAGDEIIAIGAVRIVKGRLLAGETFDCLVNPRRYIPEASVAIHGIAPQMVVDKPPIEDVLPQFHRFADDSVIVGHNVAFDMRFLELKERRTGVKFSNPVLDTLLLAAVVHPDHQQQSLESLAERFGIAVEERHSALGDAMTTARIFVALLPLLAERGIRTLKESQVASEATEYARLRY